MQHRGQDSAGIVTYNDRFNLRKGNGTVTNMFNPVVLNRLQGNTGLGHVRYPTIGKGSPHDAQPFQVNSPYGIAMVHNGNITNYCELKEELFSKNLRHLNSDSDVEVILNVFADELHKQPGEFSADKVFKAVGEVYKRLKGSYSVVAYIAGKGMVAFRDPFGIKPLVMGKNRDEYMFASETVALDYLGFQLERDVMPGEAIFIDHKGMLHERRIQKGKHRPCIFEYVYFARPDSMLDKISVYKSRLRMGKALAEQWKTKGKKADVIIPVPDTSRPAALSFSEESGIKYREGFIKNKYVGRTFIMPNQKERDSSVRHKLNPIQLEIAGKKVLLVDDSIVRGTTSKKIIKLLKDTGAEKVFFCSCCPPIKHPCIYGIDMQTKKELVASDRTIEEVRKHIGADELIYQTIEGMVKSCQVGNPEIEEFCTACFNGKYPTEDVTEKDLEDIGKKRSGERCEIESPAHR